MKIGDVIYLVPDYDLPVIPYEDFDANSFVEQIEPDETPAYVVIGRAADGDLRCAKVISPSDKRTSLYVDGICEFREFEWAAHTMKANGDDFADSPQAAVDKYITRDIEYCTEKLRQLHALKGELDSRKKN